MPPELARGDFKSMLGMSDRCATDTLGALVKRGLLKSDSPQAKSASVYRNMACAFFFRGCGRRQKRTLPTYFLQIKATSSPDALTGNQTKRLHHIDLWIS